MGSSVWPGLALLAGLGVAIAAGASCDGRPLVGSPNPDWRPVGCPQAADPPVFLADPDGDLYRMDPNNFGVQRIAAATCPMSGRISNMAINRRGEILLTFGMSDRAARVRVIGTSALSACESVTIRAPNTPITLYSGVTFAVRDEGDIGGDDLFLWGFDNMQSSSYLARAATVTEPVTALGQTRFAEGDRSDGLCRSGRSGAMDPPTCSGPRAAVNLSTWPNRAPSNRSLVGVALVGGAFQILYVDAPEDQRITEVKTVAGVPVDAYVASWTSAVWGDSLYLFVGRSTPPAPGPDAGDARPPTDAPAPTFSTVHRVSLMTGQAESDVGNLSFVPTAASVPPCMRYTVSR
jgi:hypothetical protein